MKESLCSLVARWRIWWLKDHDVTLIHRECKCRSKDPSDLLILVPTVAVSSISNLKVCCWSVLNVIIMLRFKFCTELSPQERKIPLWVAGEISINAQMTELQASVACNPSERTNYLTSSRSRVFQSACANSGGIVGVFQPHLQASLSSFEISWRSPALGKRTKF